jgi:hypothetical protein
MKKLFLVCVLTVFAVLPAHASDNPWIGTWKLDPAKSHFTGDTFTFSKAANGMMHFSDGSTTTYDFGIDGKPYKSFGDRTVTWTADGNNAWNEVEEANGTVLVKIRRELSPDGKTLKMTYSGTKPDGSNFNDEANYTRVTGTNGLAGKWRSTKVTVSAPDSFIISSTSSGIWHWDIPGYKESVEGKDDGSDLPITGPTVPPGMTLSFKRLDPNKISYQVKLAGKTQGIGIQTLAADGKSFTDVSWSPGKATEKSTAVFIKQ